MKCHEHINANFSIFLMKYASNRDSEPIFELLVHKASKMLPMSMNRHLTAKVINGNGPQYYLWVTLDYWYEQIINDICYQC